MVSKCNQNAFSTTHYGEILYMKLSFFVVNKNVQFLRNNIMIFRCQKMIDFQVLQREMLLQKYPVFLRKNIANFISYLTGENWSFFIGENVQNYKLRRPDFSSRKVPLFSYRYLGKIAFFMGRILGVIWNGVDQVCTLSVALYVFLVVRLCLRKCA